MQIAVDAMGGDRAPRVVVQGAVEAALEWGIDVILVGDAKEIQGALKDYPKTDRVEIHHCDEKILMDEQPLKAVRKKKKASITVAFELVKQGRADAVVSAGNSGATLASAIITLGKIEGIERPGFAGIFPGYKDNVIVIDVGANVDCRPVHLFQFGITGHALGSAFLGMRNPRVGLLSIGEEGGKGNEQVRIAHELFRDSDLNFAGNVEGRDIFTGRVQVIVCDGFVGNVVLKLSEGMAETVTKMVEDSMTDSLPGKIGFLFARHGFEKLKGKLDYSEYGGVPILGIKGVCIVCHGGSSSKAIKNAVKMADSYAAKNVQAEISICLERYGKKVS